MWLIIRCRRDWTGRRTSPPTFAIRTIATLVIKMLLLFSHQHYIIFKTFINTRFSGNMVGPRVAFLLLTAAFARNFWRSRPLWVRCPSLCVKYRPLWMGCRVLFAFDHPAVNCLCLLTEWPVQVQYPLILILSTVPLCKFAQSKRDPQSKLHFDNEGSSKHSTKILL